MKMSVEKYTHDKRNAQNENNVHSPRLEKKFKRIMKFYRLEILEIVVLRVRRGPGKFGARKT